jgi:hypothetical protein
MSTDIATRANQKKEKINILANKKKEKKHSGRDHRGDNFGCII